MTPSPHVYDILRRLGFVDLETSLTELFPRVCKPLPSPRLLPDLFRVSRASTEPFDPSHAGLDLDFLTLSDGHSACSLAFSKTRSYRLNYSLIHHLSDPEFFHRHLDAVRFHIWRTNGTLRLSVDSRLLGGRYFPDSRVQTFSAGAVFKSNGLQPCQIDNLGTECVILLDH